MTYIPTSVTVHIGSPPRINYMPQAQHPTPEPQAAAAQDRMQPQAEQPQQRSCVRMSMVGDQMLFLPERRPLPTATNPLAALHAWLVRP